jgi:hypothetical protein
MTMRRRLASLACAMATLFAIAGVPGASFAGPAPVAQDNKDNGVRRWSVRPAGKDGKPDTRTHFTLQSAKGGTVADAALVTNLGPRAVTFKVYGTDAFNTASGDFDLLAAAQKPTGVGAWMVFDHPTVTVGAGKSVVVPFKIVVPSNVTPGDHAGGVVVSTIAAGVTKQGQTVNVESRVAVRVYLRIPGDLQPLLAVTSVDSSYDGVANPIGKGRATVTYTITNRGNIRLTSEPTLTVKNLFGKVATLHPGKLPEILPHQSATFTAEADGVFPAGPLTTKINLAAYADPLQPVGQSIPAISATGSFWAISWLLVSIVAVLLAVLVFVWVWYRRGAKTRLRRSWWRLKGATA